MKIRAAILVGAISLTACAHQYAAIPIKLAGQEIRYTQGRPTIFIDTLSGSVQLTPLGYDKEDSRLIFGAAAFNKGKSPANFGLENLVVTSAGHPLKTYSRDELAHEARVKAAWAAVGTALAGAAAAYAANANAYSTTNGYVTTPYGISTYAQTTYNPAIAYAGTAAAGAATGYALYSIKNSMDETIANLNGSILQTNTIDPGQSAGGEVVVDLPKKVPSPVKFDVSWNGQHYEFEFNVVQVKN